MSNYQRAGFLADGDDAVIIGPETVNGTGQVYLDADPVRFLSNEQARALGRALIEAADYAKAVQDEMSEWPGLHSASVRDAAWTDPEWRAAAEAGKRSVQEAIRAAVGGTARPAGSEETTG